MPNLLLVSCGCGYLTRVQNINMHLEVDKFYATDNKDLTSSLSLSCPVTGKILEYVLKTYIAGIQNVRILLVSFKGTDIFSSIQRIARKRGASH
jgi:hypothetical protein